MNVDKYSPEFLERLVRSLVAYPSEQTWFEFKLNCADPMRIGKYLSGLSNAALLANQPFGYFLIGVDDVTHEIVDFDTKFYKQRVLECLCMKKQASAKEILDALASFLPQGRSETSSKRKIASLLSMTMSKREGLIQTVRPHATRWILTDKGMNACRNNNVSCRRKCATVSSSC